MFLERVNKHSSSHVGGSDVDISVRIGAQVCCMEIEALVAGEVAKELSQGIESVDVDFVDGAKDVSILHFGSPKQDMLRGL